ncbi:MAG: YbjQ family protein [Firmicutes bacterium]|nr:YbjQ family protein [Bacillota bacterium]
MTIVTGLSGNEMYCLHLKGYRVGELIIGNSVFSMGFIGSVGSGIRTLVGGEVTQITSIVHEGRQKSLERLMGEAKKFGADGITGVSSELVQHAGNVEFLSIASCIHDEHPQREKHFFSTSADGQELYCQLDCDFRPVKFVFGNVAYSVGVGGGILGMLKGLGRGEIHEYSQVFNTTRHLALKRITAEAKQAGANAVLGIKTSIIPFQGIHEMVMIGTASHHPALPPVFSENPITSDLTNEEMWNVIHMGYVPLQLVIGVSVYSLGLIGGIASAIKSFARGEISELTTLIYEARENALEHIRKDAASCGADDVMGVKTYVYDLGGGMIEFMAIGTAVKRMEGFRTLTGNLPPQAIIKDKDTFFNTAEFALGTNLNKE